MIRKVVAFVGKSLAVLLMASGAGLLWLSGWLVWHYEYGLGLPDHEKLAAISGNEQICSVGHNRTFIPLAEIPPLLRNAILADAEPGFYDRPAVFTEFALAVFRNHHPRSETITTRLAHCLMPPECCRGLDRPIGTLVVMNRIDKTLSKDTIFEIYLNEVYLGRGTYGVADATRSYFGKPLGELTPAEVACVVARAKRPFRDNDQESGIRFRNLALERMLGAGVISEAEAASARTQPLTFREAPEPPLHLPADARDGPSPPRDK